MAFGSILSNPLGIYSTPKLSNSWLPKLHQLGLDQDLLLSLFRVQRLILEEKQSHLREIISLIAPSNLDDYCFLANAHWCRSKSHLRVQRMIHNPISQMHIALAKSQNLYMSQSLEYQMSWKHVYQLSVHSHPIPLRYHCTTQS